MLFPSLEVEEKLQINDKTRLDAIKSFASVDDDPIAIMTITPGADADGIDIYSTTVANRYLDWQFSDFTTDIDASNNKINFNEGGSELTATLTPDTYTLAQLATEIKTQMEAAGNGTYTVTYSSDDKITIASTIYFELLGETGTDRLKSVLPMIGVTIDTGRKQTYTGFRTEYVIKKITVDVDYEVPTVPPADPTDVTASGYIKLYSVDGDYLYSTDADIKLHEPDILRYVVQGRNTFKNIHRRAQELIIAWLDKEGYKDLYGKKYTKRALINIDEVTEWSKFIALRLIFEGLSNAIDDVFSDKSKKYKGMEGQARERAVLRLDVDGDGKVDTFEDVNIRTGSVFRR